MVYGVGSSKSWTDELTAANDGVSIPLRLMADGDGPSDHAPFYLRQVPVLAFFTGVHDDYHRSTDDASRIDVEALGRVTRLVRNVVAQIASGIERPAFDATDYEPREVVAVEDVETQRVRLGAVPGPADAGEGVTVDAVVDGSPAAAGGLQSGDRIVALGGRTIRSIYDYVRALSEIEPDRPTRLVVLRGGARVELTVTPAPPEE